MGHREHREAIQEEGDQLVCHGTEESILLSQTVIGAAMEVHKHLGPGLLESAYQKAMECELALRGIPFQSQVALPVSYKGTKLGDAYRIDLLIDRALVVELKATKDIDDVHEAQLLSYLKFSGVKVGLLINFHKRLLKDGLRRLVY